MSLENYEITILKFSSTEYLQALTLRDEVLRKPLGMSIYDDDLSDEESQIHVAAILDGTVAGILLLRRVSTDTIQMRQVAVAESWQGKGIGRSLVLFAEEVAISNAFRNIMLHARETAVQFYEKLSYTKVSDAFKEVGITHFEMHKIIG